MIGVGAGAGAAEVSDSSNFAGAVASLVETRNFVLARSGAGVGVGLGGKNFRQVLVKKLPGGGFGVGDGVGDAVGEGAEVGVEEEPAEGVMSCRVGSPPSTLTVAV
jgi:hypothetical protein